MTATQSGELAARARAQRLLTHLLPGSGRELLAHARTTFHGRIDLAREGLTYDLEVAPSRPTRRAARQHLEA